MHMSSRAPWFMLVLRSISFLAVQAAIALILAVSGVSGAWSESARWWPFAAIVTNGVCIALLVRLFRSEGKRYLDLLRFSRTTWRTDLLWLVGSVVIGLPLAAAPMNPLAAVIFGDAMAPTRMMFQPLPTWAFILSFLFPITIAFAELPTYFGYAMPRLAELLRSKWAAWALASFFLALQHAFLPFLPDPRFALWRTGMFLPFAFFIGLVLKLRPRLLPYMAIVHGLMDVTTLMVYLMG